MSMLAHSSTLDYFIESMNSLFIIYENKASLTTIRIVVTYGKEFIKFGAIKRMAWQHFID